MNLLITTNRVEEIIGKLIERKLASSATTSRHQLWVTIDGNQFSVVEAHVLQIDKKATIEVVS